MLHQWNGCFYPYPANSPHLRKSGSRAVVSDLDEHEVENGAEEGFLYSGEVNDSKGGVAPISASGIMPSPIFLWRFKNLIEMDFQVFLFLVWAFICCKIGWDSLMRMSADKRDLFLYEAFLYFNQLLLVALMVWLWGINLWFFAQAGINYARIFDLDQNYLTHREIWKCCNGNRNVSGLIWTAATISVPIYSVLWNGFVLPLLSVLLLLSLV